MADHLHELKSQSPSACLCAPLSCFLDLRWFLDFVNVNLIHRPISLFLLKEIRTKPPLFFALFFFLTMFDTLMPLVVKSAGFSLVGSKRHCLGFIRVLVTLPTHRTILETCKPTPFGITRPIRVPPPASPAS